MEGVEKAGVGCMKLPRIGLFGGVEQIRGKVGLFTCEIQVFRDIGDRIVGQFLLAFRENKPHPTAKTVSVIF
jgi:hypothetical protein